MARRSKVITANLQSAWETGDWERLLSFPAETIEKLEHRTRPMQFLINAACVAGTPEQLETRMANARALKLKRREVSAAVVSGMQLRFLRARVIRGDYDGLRERVAEALETLLGAAPPARLVETRLLEILIQEEAPLEVITGLFLPPSSERPTDPVAAKMVLKRAEIVARCTVGPALGAFPVNNSDGFGGFDFAEAEGIILCAYYDDERRMVIAKRVGGTSVWEKTTLDQTIDCDSHNYIALALDAAGHIHLCGNMHSSPLVYFRSTRPLDIQSMEHVPHMLDDRESRVTYPKFLRLPDGTLCFLYRDGRAGDGVAIINRYDAKTQSWSRLGRKQFVDGEGLRSAYVHGPVRGPKGDFHICWVWRATPDAETNHCLTYASSDDLVHWRTGMGRWSGESLHFQRTDVVDDVPAGAGMINNNHLIGFDSDGRPLIVYHKFDARGFTQLHIARLDDDGWTIRQITDWRHRWDFHGRGSLKFEISLLPPITLGGGQIAQEFDHILYGRRTVLLREDTLTPIAECEGSIVFPDSVLPRSHGEPDLRTNVAFHFDALSARETFPVLTWKSRHENRDLPLDDPPPVQTDLVLLDIRKGSVSIAPDAPMVSTDRAPSRAPERDILPAFMALVRGALVNYESRLRAGSVRQTDLEKRLRALRRDSLT